MRVSELFSKIIPRTSGLPKKIHGKNEKMIDFDLLFGHDRDPAPLPPRTPL